MRDETIMDPTGAPAVEVRVSQVEWVSRDFVKAEGYWLRGTLAAEGFRFTVSRSGGQWHVDTARSAWIS